MEMNNTIRLSMKCHTWNGLGGYDRLLAVNEVEMQAIVDYYTTATAEGKRWGDDYF